MATNFEGTRAVCERIAPLIPKGGRIVNVCSLAGDSHPVRFVAVETCGGGAYAASNCNTPATEQISAHCCLQAGMLLMVS